MPGGVDPAGLTETAATWGAGLGKAKAWGADYVFPAIFKFDDFYDELQAFWNAKPLPLVFDKSVKSVAQFRFDGWGTSTDIVTSKATVKDSIKLHETVHYWNRENGRYFLLSLIHISEPTRPY